MDDDNLERDFVIPVSEALIADPSKFQLFSLFSVLLAQVLA